MNMYLLRDMTSSVSSLPSCSPCDECCKAILPSIATREAARGSVNSEWGKNPIIVISDASPRDLAHCLSPEGRSTQLIGRAEAREHLIGSTPNSPLNRPSKAALLVPCYEQAMERTSTYSRYTASVRGSDVSQVIHLLPTRPLVGQKYVVRVPWIQLRASADVCMHSPIIGAVEMGHVVRILRYMTMANGKLRVQVLTSDETVGWCTMTAEDGQELLELAPEEV
eukprot:GEMP01024295.1.p1 GENE.GEMP01024295.1~~GEMP01024295.1.p1  ORF type:complete len:224 (+),score=42.96 GEMP01024295.1:76-747(+)